MHFYDMVMLLLAIQANHAQFVHDDNQCQFECDFQAKRCQLIISSQEYGISQLEEQAAPVVQGAKIEDIEGISIFYNGLITCPYNNPCGKAYIVQDQVGNRISGRLSIPFQTLSIITDGRACRASVEQELSALEDYTNDVLDEDTEYFDEDLEEDECDDLDLDDLISLLNYITYLLAALTILCLLLVLVSLCICCQLWRRSRASLNNSKEHLIQKEHNPLL